jgi:glycerol-3-phosphate dehydrogenase
MENTFSLIIIGAGIVGTALARELSRFEGSVLLLEKGRDVALGATRANSGIVHGGYTAKSGTLKGELSIRGNRMFAQLSEELGFPYQQNGSYVLAFDADDREKLQNLLENGREIGVEQLEIQTAKQVLSREPWLNPAVTEGLYCGETGIVSPYEAAIALAENAVENGVTLRLNHEVISIEPVSDGYRVTAAGQKYTGKIVINAAGLYSDKIAALVGEDDFTIRPRRGEYLLLKRGSAEGLTSVIFQAPTAKGNGVLVTPTTWGNLLMGPNAEDTEDRETGDNNYAALKGVLEQARLSIPNLKLSSLIRFFTGVRPAADRGDFIIGESKRPGFIQAAGIESPGLTSAPAIAEKIRQLLVEKGYISRRKSTFYAVRKALAQPGILRPFAEIKSQIELPSGDPERIVCRCEQVSEKTISDALWRGIPIDSLDAVKRRTRAGMGACQGVVCAPRVKEFLLKHTGLQENEIEAPKPKNQDLLKRLRKL